MAIQRPVETIAPPNVVKHPGCPQWGLGFLIEERDDKRFYEFEDGLNHSIAKPFWSKLEPVDLGGDELAALEAKLKHQRVKAPPSKKPRARLPPTPTMSFDEQVARFESQFAGGFAGDAWAAEERGTADKKTSKAFKAYAIAQAQQELDKAALKDLLQKGDTAEILARVKRVHQAAGTLLHPLGDLIPFGKMPAERHAAFAAAAVDVLHGEGDFAARFDRYVGVLAEDKLNTWPLATVLTALAQPEEHAFVKPSFYEKEASILGMDLGYERAPAAGIYSRMQAVAREVASRLVAKGHTPRDRMDVYSFIWRMTAAPKAPKAPAAK